MRPDSVCHKRCALPLLLIVILMLTGCGLNPFRQEPSDTPIMATATLVPTLTPSGPTPTPVPVVTVTPAATPNIGVLDARYVADVTIPDGQRMSPGESFSKVWLIENNGQVAWPEETAFQHVDGPSFGPLESVTLNAREPGERAEIAVDMVAPQETGLHRSYWQLCVAQQCFGSRFWVEIEVVPQE